MAWTLVKFITTHKYIIPLVWGRSKAGGRKENERSGNDLFSKISYWSIVILQGGVSAPQQSDSVICMYVYM